MVAGSNSCEVTRSTVRAVNGCPESEESWREATERKNCPAYANYCDEPERLLYHCVINEYVNQTLEVCAYVQNIVLGRMLIMVCFFSPAISNFITVSLSVSLPIHINSFYVKPVHQKPFLLYR